MIIVEDVPLELKGTEGIVRHEIPEAEVIGTADNEASFWRLIKQQQPDLVLLDLGLGGVDVLRGGERGPIALQGDEAGGLQHADGAGLIGLIVRDGDGGTCRDVLDVLVLAGVHAQRVDGDAADRLQVLVVLDVVVGEVQQMLEFVEVELAGVDGRVLGGVVLEVDDVDVQILLLGLLLEFDPLRVGGAHDADLHRIVLGALFGGLVAAERADAEEGADRDQGDHDHGDDDVAGGVVHAHRLFAVHRLGSFLSHGFFSSLVNVCHPGHGSCHRTVRTLPCSTINDVRALTRRKR